MTRILVIEHERNADIGLFGERFIAGGATVDVVGPEIGVALPDSVIGWDGVVVLGGTPGPMEDERAPWLPHVRRLISECLELSVPYLGLCLGSQLLAHVAGGRVTQAAGGPEVGVLPLHVTAAADHDPLFADLPGLVRAVQWHWLEVAELPPGSVPLLTSGRCPVQAYRVGPSAWGTQFHPEALAATVRAWAGGDTEDIQKLGLDAAALVTDADMAEAELRATWGPVADRWLALLGTAREPGHGPQDPSRSDRASSRTVVAAPTER